MPPAHHHIPARVFFLEVQCEKITVFLLSVVSFQVIQCKLYSRLIRRKRSQIQHKTVWVKQHMGVIRWFLYVFPCFFVAFIIWSSLVPFRRSPAATSTSARRRSYSAPTSYQPRRRAVVSSPRRRAARRRAPPPPPPAPVNTRRRSTSINGQTSLVNPCEVTLRRHGLGGICKQMYKEHNNFIRINDCTVCEHKASAKSNSDFASLQSDTDKHVFHGAKVKVQRCLWIA